MALLLALVGVHVVTVKGGYRAYRKEVLSGLAGWRPPMPVYTLYGHTGAGKSAMLRALAALAPSLGAPRPWVVDLEELALHRGSLLGGLNQPGERTQKDFDALLVGRIAPSTRRLPGARGGGRAGSGASTCRATVADAIRGGLPVLVTAPATVRAERILREYAPGGLGRDRPRALPPQPRSSYRASAAARKSGVLGKGFRGW